jgi:hypothetical protein
MLARNISIFKQEVAARHSAHGIGGMIDIALALTRAVDQEHGCGRNLAHSVHLQTEQPNGLNCTG